MRWPMAWGAGIFLAARSANMTSVSVPCSVADRASASSGVLKTEYLIVDEPTLMQRMVILAGSKATYQPPIQADEHRDMTHFCQLQLRTSGRSSPCSGM